MIRRYGLPDWFINRSIRNKIIIVYIPLVIIPLLVLGYVSNRIYTESIVGKTVQSVSDNSRLIMTRIEGILQNAESSANSITLSLNRFIQEEGESGLEDDPRYDSLLVNQLNFAMLVFTDVDSAVFIDRNGRIYASHPAMQDPSGQFNSSEMMKSLGTSSGDNRWFGMQNRNYLTRHEGQIVLTLGKRVTEITTGQTLGWLLVNVDEKHISGIFPSSGPDSPASHLLADGQGTVVSSLDKDKLFRPLADPALQDRVIKGRLEESRAEFRYGGMLAVGHRLSGMDWTLVSEVPIKELTKDTDKVSVLIVALGAFCLLLVLLSAGLLSRSISTPLVRLTRTMRKVQDGSLDTRFDVRGKDEIGLLGDGFNRMIGRIRELLKRVQAEQRQKREYELALIQSQIKPHFLYNTLDVIYTLSEMGRPRDVQRTTKALADYYRIVLSKGREMITIGEELESVRDYLAIQKIRYADVFDYRIDVPSELHDRPILKLTLQPLVENAIYHGLKQADKFGSLTITGEANGESVILTVSDDGVGMAESAIADLWSEVKQEASGPSFGLRNVNARIRLYFGDAYGIKIQSELGYGTSVYVTLPDRLKSPESAQEEGNEKL